MATSSLRPVGFTGANIDRADNLRLDEGRLAEMAASDNAQFLRLATWDPVLDEAGRLAWGAASEHGGDGALIFLGLRGETPLFAPLVKGVPGQRAWSLFAMLDDLAPEDAALWGAARSLNEWHARHPRCSVCGAASAVFRGGWGRRCPACSAEHFPRVDPVVIMLAEHRGRVLLGRQPLYPPGRYSALAGFVEPGESIEEAVARELYEEAGIRVGAVRYVASQPWPFPGQLMIACMAEAESDALTLDRQELEDAIWVDRSGVAAALAGEPGAPFQAPPHFAIAHSLLAHWAEGAEPLAAGTSAA